jgi:flagella basal body P-ring formation protein FlgA
MLNKICILILLQLGVLIGSAFAEGITVIVAPEAKIEGTVITLGQVAEISGDDTGWVKSLGQLKLGSAPPLGSSMTLTKELLTMRLAASGSDFRGIVWKIPDTVIVSTSSQSISGQTLMDKAIAAVREQVALQVGTRDVTINSNGSVQELVVPVGKIELVANLPYGIHYNMPTNVTLVVNSNGQVFTKVPIKLDVKEYRQVVLAADQINLTELFSIRNLRYERMDIGRLGTGYFTDISKVLGLASRRSLKPGTVITDSMVVKPILIKRGATINIVARIGGMEVSAIGQAMQDGAEGQLIRVQNVNSAKLVSARVVDETTVQVLTYKSNG